MKTIIILLALTFTFALTANDTQTQKLRTVTINTYGMHCTGCEETIETEIKKLDGIKSVKADHIKKAVVVKYDDKKVTLTQVKEAITNAGYKLEE
jgi:copper chaperone CopZ